MERRARFLAMMLALALSLLSTLAAAPQQGKPPQPFGPDTFSGQVTVQGSPAARGLRLFACIDHCGVFQSQPVAVTEGGRYSQLLVNPVDRALVGHPVVFYLANEYGRIPAANKADFQGATFSFRLDLSFNEPVPSPTATPTVTPTAALPMPGDPAVTAIPGVALVVGAAAVLAGAALLLALRRRGI